MEKRPDVPSLERREQVAGTKVGDRRVRIVRSAPGEFRKSHGHYVATEEASRPSTRVGRAIDRVRRFLVGRPLDMGAEEEQRISPVAALGALAPSNVSSSAYATEEILRALLIGGVAALALSPAIAVALVAVLVLIVVSESRVIRAFPNGGGSYVVARAELGVTPALVAASALLVDYMLTVAVSVAAGVIAVSSAFPELADERIAIALALIALIALSHIRGVREAGALFAIPTYSYVGAMLILIAIGIGRMIAGDLPAARVAAAAEGTAEPLLALVVLRAFASGAAALTGSEAVANVVPSFRTPQARNAIVTLLLMTASLASIFLGLTVLATALGIVPDPAEIESANSMIARAVLGEGLPHLAIQLITAVFLLVAANTGLAGFPRLAAVLANDRFMPRHFADQGARLSYSFGIVAVAIVASAVLLLFAASVTALVPLYTIAVFTSFLLSQAGMLRRALRARERAWSALHGVGVAIFASLVTIILATRFAQAWVALVLIPLLALLLYSIHRHYRSAEDALVLRTATRIPRLQPPVLIVPVARLDRAALQALAFARSISDTVKAVHISTTHESAEEFRQRWERTVPEIPLDAVVSPYRSLVTPLLRYIDAIDKSDDRPITVVISEFVPHHWWEWILHSQTAFRLKAALLFRPNTIVIDVPYHTEDTADLARKHD